MNKIILTLTAILTLASCSTEDQAEVIVEPATPTNNTGSTDTNIPTTHPVSGDWELFKTETYYEWGVDTEIIICKPTLEIYSNLDTKDANCNGGGVRNDFIYKQNDIYVYNWNEDLYVYIDGELLKKEHTGDTPRFIEIYRRK